MIKRTVIGNIVISAIIAAAVAVITYNMWAFFNRPETEPPWPKIIPGFSFSPMGMRHDPIRNILPTTEEIDADLALLEGKCHAVRTYSVEGTQAQIPGLADKHNLNVALGAWIGDNKERNTKEIAEVVRLAATHRNVVRAIIGNEVALRGDIPMEQLYQYLDDARKKIDVPVSTAEPWHVWIRYAELADHVDYLAVHLLPYWEGIDLDLAVDYVANCYDTLRKAFPDKPILIAEVGWPSNGRTRRSAAASVSNEATFLRRFMDRAAQEDYNYYIMEAFDQPWKAESEGAVGAYWGVYDVNRQPKFSFSEPIVEIPGWKDLAAISIIIAIITLALLFIDSRTLKSRGRGFLAVVAYSAATAAVWIVYNYSRQYLTVSSVTVGFLLILGMIGVILVLLAEAHEWAEAVWVSSRRRSFCPDKIEAHDLPMVSIHIPTYNEPPDMMIKTLDALALLDYQKFEIIVVDNNTKDTTIWGPVEQHCRKLGSRFRFFHVDPLDGYKAGALNFALGQTDPAADIIAVIDSDYIVSPNWLTALVPGFQNPKIAIVQAPQDYRDNDQSAFKKMCYYEYKGFFHIGMITRNERNAIIQHGTMTMVRRSTLEEVKGWGEWCITEDAELGLRIFNSGYEAIYIPESLGKGLMPDTFLDYKKQRFRWACGAAQIMKRHFWPLMGFKGRLSRGQRYHFIAGWLPWIADGINLLFNLAAICWSTAMILFPRSIDPPLMMFSSLPLAFFMFKIAKLFFLYRSLIGASLLQTFGAAFAGLSLSHTIGRAILTGLVTRKTVFFRTPKLAESHTLLKAVASVREELLIMTAFLLAAVYIFIQHGQDSPDMLLWVVVLLIQTIPYFASVLTSAISTMAPPAHSSISAYEPCP